MVQRIMIHYTRLTYVRIVVLLLILFLLLLAGIHFHIQGHLSALFIAYRPEAMYPGH